MSTFGQTEEDVEAEKKIPGCFGDYGQYFNCDCGCSWVDECIHASQNEEDAEDDYDYEEEEQVRECGDSCGHFDSLNQCCWQAGYWGLCFDVQEGDSCRLGFKEAEG